MGVVCLGPVFESGLFASGARGDVLRALANFADDERHECYPSYDYLAFVAGVARETAMREVKALVTVGLLDVVAKGGGSRTTNRYRLNLDLLDACRLAVRAAKKAAGNDPAARLAAMESERDWWEAHLENGDPTSLLQSGNSDPDAVRGDPDAARGDPTSPNPSVEPSENPSARARGDAAPDGASPPGPGTGAAPPSSGAGPPAGEGKRPIGPIADADCVLVASWLGDGLCPDRLLWLAAATARGVRAESLGFRPGMGPGEVEAALQRLSPQGLAKAASWAKWASEVAAGKPGVAAPIAPVAALVARLAPKPDDPIGKARAVRCAERAGLLAVWAARARGDPDPDHRQAEDVGVTDVGGVKAERAA